MTFQERSRLWFWQQEMRRHWERILVEAEAESGVPRHILAGQLVRAAEVVSLKDIARQIPIDVHNIRANGNRIEFNIRETASEVYGEHIALGLINQEPDE